MNIVFFGSDDFAALHLKHLLASRHKVVGCVTSPDSRQGRGLKLSISPIKVLAEQNSIECLQPPTLKDPAVVTRLKQLNADLFVVVAYGKLLTQEILDIPRLFCVNVHGSLLPKYRGAAPINWAMLNGDIQTGVTVQKVALELDSGDVIAQAKIDIPPDMTADILRQQLAQLSAPFLVATLNTIEEGKFTLTAQDPRQVSYAPKLTKEMGRIDWSKPAAAIYNQIRGLKPWPGTQTVWNGKMLKVLQADIGPDGSAQTAPGTVVSVDKSGFTVACAQGSSLIIKEVQPEAGKPMPTASYMAGHKIIPGSQLHTEKY